jgi:hypothetical protein
MFIIAVPSESIPNPFVIPTDWICVGPNGSSEARFSSQAVPRLLPVRHEGRTAIVRWGAHRRDGRRLPPSGFIWLSTVQFGKWPGPQFEWVTIPATRVLHNDVWYDTPGGIRGLLVPDSNDSHGGWGYVVCEPATILYQAMTRYNWQPMRAQSPSRLR